jgi:hypothetical protein
VLERALRRFLPQERGEYHDLVTAVACPIRFSESKMRNLVREPLPPREAIEPGCLPETIQLQPSSGAAGRNRTYDPTLTKGEPMAFTRHQWQSANIENPCTKPNNAIIRVW